MKHLDQKASWEGKVSLDLYFSIAVDQKRKSAQELKQGRVLEAGADADAMEDTAYCLVSHALLSQLFYRTQDQKCRDLPHWSLIMKNALQIDLMEAFPQAWLLPLWRL